MVVKNGDPEYGMERLFCFAVTIKLIITAHIVFRGRNI